MRSVPLILDPTFDCVINDTFSGRKLTKIVTTTKIASITSAAIVGEALKFFLRDELIKFIVFNSKIGRLLLIFCGLRKELPILILFLLAMKM